MKLSTLFPLFVVLLCFQEALLAPTPPNNTPPSPPTRTPGKSGIKVDDKKGVVHVSYGDNLPNHMQNLQANHQKYPANNRPFPVGNPGDTSNRKAAIKSSGLPPQPGQHRDEKPLNIQKHDGKTTVRYVPADESRREGALIKKATTAARQTGYQMQLHPNPSQPQPQQGTSSDPRRSARLQEQKKKP